MFSLEPVKGRYIASSFSLSELIASGVISDAYFNNAVNISKVIVKLKSSQGGQEILAIFSVPEAYDGSQDLNSAIYVSPNARDSFELAWILVYDKQGGYITIKASQMSSVSDFAITFTSTDIDASIPSGQSLLPGQPLVLPGNYENVTVDSLGRVVSGNSPTTLVGYGITDAVKNDGGIHSLQSGTNVERLAMASPVEDMIFFSVDTKAIHMYSSGSWIQLSGDVSVISDSISDEVSARQAADAQLASDISDEVTNRSTAVSAEASARQSAILSLQNSLASEVSNRSSGDSSTLASAQSYTDQKIADVIGAAPAALDTLKELADQLADDQNMLNVLINSVADESSARLSGIAAEAADRQAADLALQTQISSKSSSLDLQDHANASSGVHGVSGSVVGTSDSQVLTHKSIDALANTISNISNSNISSSANINHSKMAPLSANKAMISDSLGAASASDVTASELEKLVGVSSNIQSQLDGKASSLSLSSHASSSSSVHGVSGSLVGTSDSQTLSNKVIDASSNTISNISNSNISNSAHIDFSKMESMAGSRAVVTDSSGVVKVSSITSDELSRLSGVSSNIQDQLNAEVSARSAALNSEASVRQSAISSLESSLSSSIEIERNARIAADATLTSAISAEQTRAQNAESTLTSQVSGLQSQINNVISNTNPAALDSLSEVVAAFEAADSNLNSAITAMGTSASSALGQETSRAQAAEGVLTTNLATEIARAEAAEATLSSNVSSVTNKVNAAYSIQNDIIVVSKSIDAQAVDMTFGSTQSTDLNQDSSIVNVAALNMLISDEQSARIAADATKEPAITAGTSAQYFRGDKTFQTLDKSAVGLSNVDNTSDASKNTATATLMNKTINASSNTISNIANANISATAAIAQSKLAALTASKALVSDLSGVISTSSVTSTELGYLSGVAGNVQSLLNTKEPVITAGTTGQYYRGDKSFQTLDKTAVGLANVDNTSDATKNSATATLTNKTISAASNTISGIADANISSTAAIAHSKMAAVTASKALVSDASGIVAASTVTSTELGYLSGVTSNVQTQLNSLSSGGSYVGIRGQVFTTVGAANTFTVPAGITAIKVTVVGGGGGGIYVGGTAYNTSISAGGGGTAIKYLTGLTPGTNFNVVVGSGGSYNSSSSGTSSSFGFGVLTSVITATGGAYGGGVGGGSGGAGSNGDINIPGSSGFWPINSSFAIGGQSILGFGGRTSPSAAAGGYGAGGSNGGAVGAGTAGTQGIVIVEW